MKKSLYPFVLLVAFVLTSCGTFRDVSIEKRHYRKGYYVHVRDDRSTEKTAVAATDLPVEEKALAEKSTGENPGSVVENSTQRETQALPENHGLKKYFQRLSDAKPFKKGKAVFREQINQATTVQGPAASPADDDDRAVALFLLIILAILLPPLAVLLADGVGINFLVDLIFWLLGFGFVVFISGAGFIYLGIFGLIAIIYALLVVFDVI